MVRKGTDGKKDVLQYLYRVYNVDKLHTCTKPQTADVVDDVFFKLLEYLIVNASSRHHLVSHAYVQSKWANVVGGKKDVATLLYSKLPLSPRFVITT